jgi:hypothetical protein
MTSKRLPRVLVLSGAAPPSVGGAESLTHVLAVVVSRGDDDRGVSDRYPSMTPPTFDGTTILSADVAEITILKQALVEGAVTVDRGRAVVAESGHPRLDAVVSKLWDEGRMLFFPKGREDHLRGRRPLDQSIDFLAPLNPRAGLLTESERLGNPLAAFNAGFFIWAEEEFLDGPFASMHDPVGLVIEDGEIRWPPVYRRNALFVDTGTFALHDHEERYGLGIDRLVFAQCGLAEVAVRLPGDVVVVGPAYQDGRRAFGHAVDGSHVVRARVNEPARRGEAAFVNRLWPAEDARSMATHFPAAKDGSGYELILVGRNIAGRNIGGDAFIPSHGFVVSLNALRHAVGSMRRWPQERRRWWSSTLTSVRPAGRPWLRPKGGSHSWSPWNRPTWSPRWEVTTTHPSTPSRIRSAFRRSTSMTATCSHPTARSSDSDLGRTGGPTSRSSKAASHVPTTLRSTASAEARRIFRACSPGSAPSRHSHSTPADRQGSSSTGSRSPARRIGTTLRAFRASGRYRVAGSCGEPIDDRRGESVSGR